MQAARTVDDTALLDKDKLWARLAAYVREVEKHPRSRRIQQIERLVRDPRVREVALECFGKRCQVRGCQFIVGVPSELIALVLEVHHLRAVVRGGSDQLFNLAVLCANHHRLCERLPEVEAIQSEGADDVVIKYSGGSFLIERDLTTLRKQLAGTHESG